MSVCPRCNTPIPIGALRCPGCGAPIAATPIAPAKKSSNLVWIIVGCVIAVPVLTGILGIVAAIVIPNFLDAVQKANQKRAVADLRQMGQAIDRYQAVHGFAPAAADIDRLAAAVAPDGSVRMPKLDPWKHPYVYLCWQEAAGAAGCDHFRIASTGRDGKLDADLREAAPGEFPRHRFDHDIVYGDGSFVAAPDNSSR